MFWDKILASNDYEMIGIWLNIIVVEFWELLVLFLNFWESWKIRGNAAGFSKNIGILIFELNHD